jgi:hypothetical protein
MLTSASVPQSVPQSIYWSLKVENTPLLRYIMHSIFTLFIKELATILWWLALEW